MRKQADDVRWKLLTQLEGVAGDLEKLLEEARTNDGKQPKCPQCGGFIPGVSRLNLKDTLMAWLGFHVLHDPYTARLLEA